MGTTDLTAATSILRYWLDIEALTPPSVESEAGFIRVDDRTPDINWTMGLPDDRQQRTINIVHIGLFNLEFAAQDIARRLAVAEDEDFDVAPSDRR